MSQRRSYPNSGDFNLDDLFRPEPGEAQQPSEAPQQPAMPQPPAGQPSAVPQQQAAPPVAGQGGPEYWGPPPQAAPQAAAPVDPAPATQYLPPYPAGDPSVGAGAPGQPYQQQPGTMGGQQTFGGQQAFDAYGQPAAQPYQQPYQQQPGTMGGQQTFGGQQAFDATQSYGQPAQPAYEPSYGAPAAPGRPNNQKLIIGGVVAGVAAAGILVAVLMSGGDDGKGKGTAPVAKTSSSQSAPAAGDGALSAEGKTQAQALSDLLATASASRQAVVSAVTSVGKCENLPDAQAKLTAAAAQRQDLLTKLGALKVDKLPDGAKLAEQLQKAWQASSGADSEYALWAADAVAGCDPAKAKDNPHYKNGNDASGQATTAKSAASDLWNTIAGKAGLPTKDKSEL